MERFMTLAEMIADLNSRIGSEPEISNSQMIVWLNQALLAFCNVADFTWLEQISYASTVDGQDTYAVPTNNKRIFEVKIDDERYAYVPYEQRDLQDPANKYFTVVGNSMIINPVPTSTGSSNIKMTYIKRPTKMALDSDTPSSSAIASMPEVYHEALVIYAFSIYNTYDEEHGEAQSLMGNELRPIPGTFYWFVKEAKKEDQKYKKGARRKFLSSKSYYGYSNPNEVGGQRQVLA